MLGNIQLRDFFVYYCCTVGIIGNLVTCFLLKRRINDFNHYLMSRRMALVRADARVQLPGRLPSTLHIDKCVLFDYRHNWNLYLYFIGVNVFDTIILLNWIISLGTYNLGYTTPMLYNMSGNQEYSDDIMNATRLDRNDYENLHAAMKFDENVQINYSLPFNSLLEELGRQIR